jgi:hypothetical protein
MDAVFENQTQVDASRIANLENQAQEIERTLVNYRKLLEQELASGTAETEADNDLNDPSVEDNDEYDAPSHTIPDDAQERRTEELISHGRRSQRRRRRPGRLWLLVAGGAALAGALIALLVGVVFTGSPSWPPSVAAVQAQIATACQNPDIAAEPNQVNFACAPATRQILWVFSLMGSIDSASFSDPKTGRKGLEPITPAQGGEIAWSLNLHHPYNPLNPIDSLEVAARAINNIIGGATLTSTSGSPDVQAGLESSAQNCALYTGSSAVVSRQGYPGMCASSVTTQAGMGALVANIYQEWVVGASPATAQDAAVLFENANNPGNPEVQAILSSLTP